MTKERQRRNTGRPPFLEEGWAAGIVPTSPPFKCHQAGRPTDETRGRILFALPYRADRRSALAPSTRHGRAAIHRSGPRGLDTEASATEAALVPEKGMAHLAGLMAQGR